jgi:hypothetical protein
VLLIAFIVQIILVKIPRSADWWPTYYVRFNAAINSHARLRALSENQLKIADRYFKILAPDTAEGLAVTIPLLLIIVIIYNHISVLPILYILRDELY